MDRGQNFIRITALADPFIGSSVWLKPLRGHPLYGQKEITWQMLRCVETVTIW